MNWLRTILNQPPVMRKDDYAVDSQAQPAVVPQESVVPKSSASTSSGGVTSNLYSSSFINLHSIDNPSVKIITEGLINIDRNLNILLNVLKNQLAFDKAQADVIMGGDYAKKFGTIGGSGQGGNAPMDMQGGGITPVIPIVKGNGKGGKGGKGGIKAKGKFKWGGKLLGGAAVAFAIAEAADRIQGYKEDYARGDITKEELDDNSTKTATGLIGALTLGWAGAQAGASGGAVAGPWGAAIGGVAGGLGGAFVGSGGGEWVADQIPDSVKIAQEISVQENGKTVRYTKMRDGKYRKTVEEYEPVKSRGQVVDYINRSKTTLEKDMTPAELATAKKYLAPTSPATTTLTSQSMKTESAASKPAAPIINTINNSTNGSRSSPPSPLSTSEVMDPSGPIMSEVIYF